MNTQLSIHKSGILQGKAYRILQNNLAEALTPFELTILEWKTLALITEYKKLTTVHLARLLDVETPLITRLCKSLNAKKRIQKVTSEKDKRIHYIYPTEKTMTEIFMIEKSVQQAMGVLLQGVTLDELKIYKKVLLAISHNGVSKPVKKCYTIE